MTNIERRLWPRFTGAIDAGNLPTQIIRQVERLFVRLPDLCIPETDPSLLHGDAQQNNFISIETGAMVIDPGFHERRDLWRISAYLATVTVEGDAYLNQLTRAVQKYL